MKSSPRCAPLSELMKNPPSASIIEDLEDLYENAPCGYLSLDPGGRIFKVNKTLCNWVGYAPEHLLGKRLGDLLNIAGRMFYETHIAPLLRMQGFFNEVALDLVSQNGDRLPVIANATERRAADGSVISTRLTLLKATDRRRYERELLDARDQSRSSEAATRAILEDERRTSELREQFIAVLGHDLRNPLASISAGARILLRQAKGETETQVLQMMQTTVMRMSGLIDNVLDFARGRLGGGITLSRDANRPLRPVLQHVVDELRTAMPDRVIESDLEIADPVNCDRSRIGQMVSNLLGNALTHGSPDQPVKMVASTDNGMFVLWIANAGEPIPDAAMVNLFQPFFRGTVRASLQGLGLGLHIASEIAKAHEGVLTVTSTAEETRFTFRMPLRV
ncbi:PAS/PAC sensor signal transduction histidine kinase [Bradyrhizobium erythrophlei]|jgi:sigma-B regulation protein RsbU (phosphoserine phosphatase)|uniref:histidine kinase n=2 Tax=Bradyrhizobium erythrophlei TaxID=1437360 RepID=A0A1M5N5Z2_9BRAD|nr:PAS/PAC sensor signal transduction histidine kinase [Bradyrhizobium erythrophlei]